jgi:hypothetical protein
MCRSDDLNGLQPPAQAQMDGQADGDAAELQKRYAKTQEVLGVVQ